MPPCCPRKKTADRGEALGSATTKRGHSHFPRPKRPRKCECPLFSVAVRLVLAGRIADRRGRLVLRLAEGRRARGVVPVTRRARLTPGHDLLDLLLVDGLVLHQCLGHRLELVEIRREDLARALEVA